MKGKAHVFGDNVNTDEIIPARYLNRIDPAFLGAHCMEDADPEFVRKAARGDVIVEDGAFTGQPGRGQFIKRNPGPPLLS